MKKSKHWNYGRPSAAGRVFDIGNAIVMLVLCFAMLYPMWYVVCCSLSEPAELVRHSGPVFWPLKFTAVSYEKVLSYQPIWNGYKVTIFVVVVGTALNLLFTSMLAYVLSRRNLLWSKVITGLCIFTMYFSGGMIPTFLVVKAVGLYDSIWALIIPGLISTYYVIILRTALTGVPKEMIESAELDGANEMVTLVRILLPLIMPTIAAISLFIVVGYWNSWTNALLYIQDNKKMPLQMVLRQIVVNNDVSAAAGTGASNRSGEDQATRMLLKYATIMVSVIPIICVYPFLQKYFTKGVMVGALKG